MKLSCWLATAVVIVIVASSNHSSSAYIMPTGTLACFSRPKGGDTKECEKIHGFRTCYTRYDIRGKVTGRGCSTQLPNFKTCDTHKYGKKKSEKYCYCTKDFCNTSSLVVPNTILLGCLVITLCCPHAYLIAVQLLVYCHLAMCSLCCHIAHLLTCLSHHVRSYHRDVRT